MGKRLVRFKELRGSGGREDVTFRETGVPITDPGLWEGRWVLCRLTLERSEGTRLELTDAVVSVSRERRIVSTALVGRDRTVKEYINDGDWAVNIVAGLQAVRDGVIADEWPGEEVRELRRFLEAKEALRVHSEFLDVFGITRLVVRSYGATQMTESNYQGVSISAVSDEEVELYSTEY